MFFAAAPPVSDCLRNKKANKCTNVFNYFKRKRKKCGKVYKHCMSVMDKSLINSDSDSDSVCVSVDRISYNNDIDNNQGCEVAHKKVIVS